MCYNENGGDMNIIPAWLIDKLERIRKEREEMFEEGRRLYIDAPMFPDHQEERQPGEEDNTGPIVIPVR